VSIHKDHKANVKKGDWYKTVDASSGDFSIQTVIDKKEHAFRRRVIGPAFSDKALGEQEQFIDENVRIFMSQLAKGVGKDGWSTPKDFAVWITYYGFDFISDLSFGSRFKLLEEEDHRYLPDLLMNTSHFLYYASYLPLSPLVRFVMGTNLMDHLPSQNARDTHKYYKMAGSILGERETLEKEAKANGKEIRRDIFHYLFRSTDPVTGLGLSQQKLQADAGLLIAAGSDGVAVTVSAAMFYLLRNPEQMNKLVKEIRENFESLEEIKTPKLNQMQYLAAVIDEALRLAPSVPSPFPRKVLPGGLIVDGERIPEGITVGVAAYAIHHNEDIYPDSFAFRPERWIAVDEKEKERISVSRTALLTFGAGPYNCIGLKVALLACKLVMAKLLYKYDIRAADDNVTGGGGPGLGKGREREEEYQVNDFLVSYRNGPMVEVREREA
jgi:cytochrome P450